VLATAMDNWSGKPFCVSSLCKPMPKYNNALSHYKDSVRLPPKKAFS
jgi:hypothetical protein